MLAYGFLIVLMMRFEKAHVTFVQSRNDIVIYFIDILASLNEDSLLMMSSFKKNWKKSFSEYCRESEDQFKMTEGKSVYFRDFYMKHKKDAK